MEMAETIAATKPTKKTYLPSPLCYAT